MLSRDISRYSRLRYEIRAYMCFIVEQNIKNYLPNLSVEHIERGMQRISQEIPTFDALYLIDANGILINQIIGNKHIAEVRDFSNRVYYYETIKDKRCVLTDPYPSRIGGKLVVTAAYPFYNDKGELVCIACIDMAIKDALNLNSSSFLFEGFSQISALMYGALAVLLSLVALLLLFKGANSLISAVGNFRELDIKEIFESTILLTLSLAIFDLVKAIFEEEILGKNIGDNSRAIHKTMTRFLGSIIIAIAIEALMLVFKFSITQPENLLYAVYLTAGVAMLLIGLAIYVKFAFAAAIQEKNKK